MIKTTPSKPTVCKQSSSTPSFSQRAKLTVSALALLICTACGGGGTSSTTPTAPPPVSVNQAPVASAGSTLSIVAEGQKFELDASGSTDSDGDSLTYSWQQLSGPAIDMASATSETLSLTAPLLDADEDVSFELTVSDGTLSNVSTVSLNIEDLKVDEVLSESTEFGTGGPTNPVETVADPSVFEGGRSLVRIIGLTPETGGGYRVHWTSASGGHDTPVSSQVFSVEGEKSGGQTDGVFLGGDRGTIERNGVTSNRFVFGISFATIQSGDTLFNFNGELEFTTGLSFQYTSHRGLVEGEVDGFGDLFIDYDEVFTTSMGGAVAPIAGDKVLLILGTRTTENVDDADANVILTSYIVDEFGQVETHDLDPYVSNGTTQRLNGMSVAAYNGDSYLTTWAQNTPESGYEIRMQRATQDGVILGPQVTLNEATGGDQLLPRSATLTNGNMVVTWLSPIEGDNAAFEIRARVVRPDGSFATDEVSLGGNLLFETAEPSPRPPIYEITSLNTNEVLVTWEDTAFGAESDAGEDPAADVTEVKAMAFDANLNAVSNVFSIAAGDASANIDGLTVITLPDNRAILGWYNNHPSNDEREDTSHTVGFYPVGKE